MNIKNIIVKLIYVLLIPIIIWDLLIMVQTIRNPNEVPSVNGIKTFCIVSGSMRPEIDINDVVIVKEVPETEINVGDVISFNTDGEIVTHRIIAIEKGQYNKNLYITKGDANNVEDEEKITYEDIEGKYINKIPKVGKIIFALKSKTTLVIVLAVLILLYMIEQKSNNKKIQRSKIREQYEKEERK